MEYDYVIVGGGTAGLVLANRLSEDAQVSVCIIEASDRIPDSSYTIPGLARKKIGHPEIDWGLYSTPQEHAHNRVLNLPRGKILGGSSVANMMAMSRAHSKEYDAFEQLGSQGWTWSSLLPYFKKSETFVPPSVKYDSYEVSSPNSDLHGDSGPVQRTSSNWFSKIHSVIIGALEALGVKYNPDGNSGDNTGSWITNFSIHPLTGRRNSAYIAYYEPCEQTRPNLTLVSGTIARQILLKNDGDGMLVAIGVECSTKDATVANIKARRELIISTGTFKTPQLLELSGIGDEELLSSIGIQTVLNLPGVGNNYQEHPRSTFTIEMDAGEFESIDTLDKPEYLAEQMAIFAKSGTGVLASTGTSVLTFLSSQDANFMDQSRLNQVLELARSHIKTLDLGTDIQLNWFKDSTVPFIEFGVSAGLLPLPGFVSSPDKLYLSLFIVLLHPFSRGSVHIRTTDPDDPPDINPSIFENPADIETMLDAIKFARSILAQASIGKEFEVSPGPQVQTDDELKDYLRKTVTTIFHPIGTAAMLPVEDGGVVDSELRVYGTTNLRVVDASIIPIQLSAHTQATVYAIAEKAADMIKAAYPTT